MKKIKIIADKYLNDNGLSISIGGVETYIHNLCNLLIKMNYYIDVYQYGNISKDCFFDGVNVHIIKQESRKKFVDLVRHASIRVDYKNDLLLYCYLKLPYTCFLYFHKCMFLLQYGYSNYLFYHIPHK